LSYLLNVTSLTIKLPQDTKARLKAQARLRGKSVSALVRDCLKQSNILTGPHDMERSLYERAKDLCGAGDSGVTDLSTNPKYMKGFGR